MIKNKSYDVDSIWSRKSIRSLLSGLNEPALLSKHPITNTNIVYLTVMGGGNEDTPLQRAFALLKIVDDTLNNDFGALDVNLSNYKKTKHLDENAFISINLHMRYFEERTRLEVAEFLGYGRALSTYDQKHAKAIESFSKALYFREQDVKSQLQLSEDSKISRIDAIVTKLPSIEYPFVTREEVDSLLEVLNPTNPQWIVFVYGESGIGKTALVSEGVKRAIKQYEYETIVWLDAGRQKLDIEGSIVAGSPSVVNLDGLFDHLSDLTDPAIKNQDSWSKKTILANALSTKKILVVVDGYETLLDKENFENFFRDRRSFPPYCKVVIISREKGIMGRVIKLDKMNSVQAREFLNTVCVEKGIPLIDSDSNLILSIADGNPLVIEQTVIQVDMENQSPNEIVKTMLKGQTVSELLEFLFQQAYNDISAKSQYLLQICIGFSLDFSRTALQEISGFSQSELSTNIKELREKTLIRDAGYNRYSVSPLVREFVSKVSDLDQKREILNKTVEYFINYCKQSFRQTDRIYEEKENIIELIEWSFENENWSQVISLGRYLSRAFWVKGNYKDRVKLGELLLSSAYNINDEISEAWILVDDLGWTNLMLGNIYLAEENVRKAIVIFEKNNEKYGLAKAHRHLAGIIWEKGDKNTSRELIETAETLAHSIAASNEKSDMLASIYHSYSFICQDDKEYLRAKEYAEQAMSLYLVLDDQERYVKMFSEIAYISSLQGDIGAAKDFFIRGSEAAKKVGRKDEQARNLFGLAQIEESVDLAEQALILYEEMGVSVKIEEIKNFINRKKSIE